MICGGGGVPIKLQQSLEFSGEVGFYLILIDKWRRKKLKSWFLQQTLDTKVSEVLVAVASTATGGSFPSLISKLIPFLNQQTCSLP